MADTPEARAAEALKLADLLEANPDTAGAHGDDAAGLLRALAADVKEMVGDYLEVQALRGEDDALIKQLMTERDELLDQLQQDAALIARLMEVGNAD